MLQRRTRVSGLVLLLLAHWVNASLFLVLIPLVIFRYLLKTDSRAAAVRSVGLTLIGAAVGLLAKRLSHAPNTDTGFSPISSWPVAWLQLFRSATKSGPADSVANHFSLLWIVVPACVGLAVALATRKGKYSFAVVTSWVVTALGFGLFVGTLIWIRLNVFSLRYVYSSMFLVAVAMAVLAISPFKMCVLDGPPLPPLVPRP